MWVNRCIYIYLIHLYFIECLNFNFFLVGFARPGGLHFIPKKVRANPVSQYIYTYL